ncbi:c-type cytochrome biogenesis protein CcmI [Alphaproteobacteria bacterium]|nr:c-type cytochrome biogenesis protein CcmI [Alphaproteobacteria bacterium]
MIFWLIAGTLTFVSVLALVWPIINGTEASGDRGEHGLRVYRDQLDELERDHAQGRIGSTDLAAARIEIQRRMLAADTESREAGENTRAPVSPSRQMLTIVLLVFLVPAAALAAYMNRGNPALPNQPFSSRADERFAAQQSKIKALAQAQAQGPSNGQAGQAGQHEGMTEMVERLEKRLKDNPRDLKGWVLLGRSYLINQEYPKAAKALRQAVGLSQGDPRTLAAYGEALTMAADGSVTPDALGAFEEALNRVPGEPRARFYVGLAASQREDFTTALKHWVSLEADTPLGAGWEAMLKGHIERITEQSGIDVDALRLAERTKRPAPLVQAKAPPTTAPTGPTQGQVAAAQNMSPEDRQKMIRGMVKRLAERLEQNPDDVDGWMRLGRSHGVLNQPADSIKAYARAAKQAPERIDVQMAYARALFPKGTPETAMPGVFKNVIGRVLKLDPALSEAMFYGGMIAANEGDVKTARDLWGRLLERLEPDAPVRPALERRLKALEGG